MNTYTELSIESVFLCCVGIAKYHQVSLSIKLFNIFVGCRKFLSNIVGIVRYSQVLQRPKKHFNNLVPSSDFLVLHHLGIGLSVLGMRLDRIGKYISKI